MRTIQLDSLSFLASPNEKKFILLRSEGADNKEFLEDIAIPKILNRDNAHKIKDVWGTIGYANNDPIDWKGEIQCSNIGNESIDQRSPFYGDIELLKRLYPNLNKDHKITEKFINLSDVEFSLPNIFSLDDIPKLRLDVFLGPDQGALAFYQHFRFGSNDEELDYILPQATRDPDTNEVNHNTNKRDRLSYLFNIIPQHVIEPVDDLPGMYHVSSKLRKHDFIIKVLIFERVPSDEVDLEMLSSSEDIVHMVEDRLESYDSHLFVKKPKLLVMDDDGEDFSVAKTESLDGDKKTLLLLHGTFASTKGSFGEVYSWIHGLLNSGKYDQVLAFDHPTFYYDAIQNANVLFSHLNDAGIQKFSKEVDIIGTSQGGLIAQYLANTENNCMKVGKVALVASANGVGYFTFADGMATAFKVLKKVLSRIGFIPAAFALALLQHSFEWIIKQPGMDLMKPHSKRLNDIIFSNPRFRSTRYLPVAGNYQSDKWYNRPLQGGIDKILTEHNDWVVSTKNQYTVPSEYVAIEGYNPGKYQDEMINDAKHGSLIETVDSKKRIEKFLLSTEQKDVDHLKKHSTDLIDVHCHLFGSNSISARLMFMLLGDLADYLTKENRNEERRPIDIRDKDGFGIFNIIKNALHYFVFNKGGHEMLHDLQEDYINVESPTYRYAPLMFDLEMTFRNKYDEDDSTSKLRAQLEQFEGKRGEFLDTINNLIERFEKYGEFVFDGSRIQNEESIRFLKYAKTILKGLSFINSQLESETKSSFHKQLNELKQLKITHGNDILPFLSVDPRRPGMSEKIEEEIGKGIFHGVKIYSPNGYSPTDLNLYDPSKEFVGGTSLYQWCIDNDIPIMAHCSDGGFATMTEQLQVYGHICTHELDDSEKGYKYRLEFKDKEYYPFQYHIGNGGLKMGIKERAHALNHPTLWRKVLEKYPDLKICLAHFGGGSDEWQEEIAALIQKYKNVYTDLSCQLDYDRLKKINDEYFDTDPEKREKFSRRIMYGSDYFLNVLHGIKFKNYHNNFEKAFGKERLKYMSFDVVKEYLGV